jgi:hypothetical protein
MVVEIMKNNSSAGGAKAASKRRSPKHGHAALLHLDCGVLAPH